MSLQNESSQPQLGAKKGLNMLAESVHTSSPFSPIQVNSESCQEQSSIVLSPNGEPARKLIQLM